MILKHLAEARRHVVEAKRHLARQRALIEHLEHENEDASAFKEQLKQFEELYALHVADRDRLKKELAEATT